MPLKTKRFCPSPFFSIRNRLKSNRLIHYFRYLFFKYFNSISYHYLFKKKAFNQNLIQSNDYLRKRLWEEKDKVPIHAIFLFHESQLFENFYSVYQSMVEDSSFKPMIVVVPKIILKPSVHKELTEPHDLYHFLEKRNIPFIKAYNENTLHWLDLKELKPDVVFYLKPYESSFSSLQYSIDFVNQYALTCYIPYGIISLNSPKNQYGRPFHRKCWTVFCESEYHKNMYERHGRKKTTAVVSHPKLDYYIDKKFEVENRQPRQKTIIWAPHWSVNTDRHKTLAATGTFDKNYPFFLHLVQKYSSIQWILKPHPSLKYQMVTVLKLLSEEAFDGYLAKWRSFPNTHYYNKGDYFPLFIQSDALITDCISFLIEYLPTTKPVFMLCKNLDETTTHYNAFAQKVVKTYYKGNSNEQIESFIRNVVCEGHDALRTQRVRVYERIGLGKTHSGREIKTYLKRALL